jgi:murein L,D-transpeptidase YcbB/YkuD
VTSRSFAGLSVFAGAGTSRRPVPSILLAIALAWAASSRAADFDADLRARIGALLADPGLRALGEPIHERAEVARFYAERSGAPAWTHERSVREPLARDLLGALQQAGRHGLRPNDYHAAALERELAAGDRDADHLGDLDVLLSDAFLHLAHHLARGAVDPRTLHPGFQRASEPALDIARVLAAGLEAGKIAEALSQSAPPHPEYQALVLALARLREAAAAGDLAAAAHTDQVRANLERWRWLPRDLGARHLIVNIARYRLQAFDAGQVRLEQRVVVGEKDWKTPLASGAISDLVLNPAWRVPESIATKEMLPAARRNPSYFREKGIQVLAGKNADDLREIDTRRVDWRRIDPKSFPYHLRQPPGPHNPLGQIKFVFANPFGVYLHGTPGDRAFARNLRALSHGCVRVEEEIALAEFALAPDPAWTRERLVQTLANAWEYRLPLPQPLPVYLVYLTASARADGAPEIGVDPYGWDRELLAALDAPQRAQGSIHTGVPGSLRAARKSMSASASPMQP